jgi:hypothetical protein
MFCRTVLLLLFVSTTSVVLRLYRYACSCRASNSVLLWWRRRRHWLCQHLGIPRRSRTLRFYSRILRDYPPRLPNCTCKRVRYCPSRLPRLTTTLQCQWESAGSIPLIAQLYVLNQKAAATENLSFRSNVCVYVLF